MEGRLLLQENWEWFKETERHHDPRIAQEYFLGLYDGNIQFEDRKIITK